MALCRTLKADGLYALRRGDVATPLRGMNDDLYKATCKPNKIENEVIEKAEKG